MNAYQLSQRLNRAVEFVRQYGPESIRLVDIGSDHAYLPCHMALNQELDYAVAGEVVAGPYQSARAEVASHQLQELVDVRFGDGFDVIEADEAFNVATICGMGGSLIRDILSRGHFKLALPALLILQANIAEPQLRDWLYDHQYQIIDEDILHEHQHNYEIIVARRQGQALDPLSPAERLFGPYNLERRNASFVDKWQREYENRTRILAKIKEAKVPDQLRIEQLSAELSLIKEVLSDVS